MTVFPDIIMAEKMAGVAHFSKLMAIMYVFGWPGKPMSNQ